MKTKQIALCIFTFTGILSTLAVDTTPPVLHITTPDTTVGYATQSMDISGTSERITSSISWKNERTGATGSIAESSSWTITGIPLVPGENKIKVWGSSNYGHPSDEVLIIRNYSPTTRLVSPDSPADGPGTTWSNAFHTIQAAVDASSDNYTILVSNGVYETGGAPASANEPLTNRVCVTKPLTIKSLNGPSKTFIVGEGNQSALDLDGAESNYVSVASSDALNLTNNYTIEAWIYPRSFRGLAGIVSKYHHAAANGYMLRLSSPPPYRGLTIDEVSTTNTTLLSSNQWYHIAAVNDNGTRHLYVNGVEEALSTNDTPLNIKSNSDPLVIGCDFVVDPRFFDGLIDEVRVWNVVRTQSEIQQNMYKRVSTVNTNLVGYWKLDDKHGSVALDSSLSQNNGKLIDRDSWSSTNLVDVGSVRCARLIKNSVLSGFTLKDGTTLPAGDQNLDCGAGGALLYYGGTLTNCVIENNFCYGKGGGINLYHAGTIRGCLVKNNHANKNGGGISNNQGTLVDSTIENNSAYSGGGISSTTTHTIQVKHCTIQKNVAVENGAGTFYGSLTNCIVRNNRSERSGGGSYYTFLTDCIVTNNTATFGAGTYRGKITACEIAYNKATTLGGGSYYSELIDCEIHHNEANDGGGTHTGTQSHCSIFNNIANSSGGGSYQGVLTDCVVSNNTADSSGGGVDHGKITNSKIVNNTARNGGGLSYTPATDCIISNNNATYYGGGIYEGSTTNCIIQDNKANSGDGGGARKSNLVHCQIYNNTAKKGGGLSQSSATNCIIRNNHANNAGGGNENTTLTHCEIYDNFAVNHGGGVYLGSATNCIIRNNLAQLVGGGVREATVVACTIVKNQAGTSSGGSFQSDLTNCIVFDNASTNGPANVDQGTVSHCCVASPDTSHGIYGNITNAPLFVDADANNFHLQTNSPCIDAGLNGLLATDFEGTPRPLDGDNNGTAIADMGCYELMNNAADSDGDSASDGDEIIADTNPTDSNSWFHITSSTNDGSFATISFDSSSKREYYLVSSTNLTENIWTEVIGTRKTGVDGSDYITITNDLPLLFYKLEVERN